MNKGNKGNRNTFKTKLFVKYNLLANELKNKYNIEHKIIWDKYTTDDFIEIYLSEIGIMLDIIQFRSLNDIE